MSAEAKSTPETTPVDSMAQARLALQEAAQAKLAQFQQEYQELCRRHGCFHAFQEIRENGQLVRVSLVPVLSGQ